MIPDAAIRLARRYVWWQEPAETLADVRHVLRQIMALGRPDDYKAALELWVATHSSARWNLLRPAPWTIDRGISGGVISI